jgi:hypothetical protein
VKPLRNFGKTKSIETRLPKYKPEKVVQDGRVAMLFMIYRHMMNMQARYLTQNKLEEIKKIKIFWK